MDLVRKDGIGEVEKLRKNYLDRLCQPQELYSELMMKESVPYVFVIGSEEGGYCLVGDEKVLLEFHIEERFIPLAGDIFGKVIDDLKIEKAMCQSFDHLFLSQCMLKMKERKIIGYQFRDRIEPTPPIPDFHFNERVATRDDIDLITRHREEIFEDNEVKDIPYYIGIGSIIIFEDDVEGFIGYGIQNRTFPNRPWYDIGMYVNSACRKRGYGRWIIDRMADIVTMKGGHPTAGCDINNVGSKKTLESGGFITKHVMIEFNF